MTQMKDARDAVLARYQIYRDRRTGALRRQVSPDQAATALVSSVERGRHGLDFYLTNFLAKEAFND